MAQLSNKTFIICRHGKTEWNASGLIQGRKNSSLLPSSKKEIKALGKIIINKFNPEITYCSPLIRAQNSAEIAGLNNIIIKEELAEINHGIYEGKTHSQIDKNWLQQRNTNKWTTKWPNGESYSDVQIRILSFLQSLDLTKSIFCIMAHESLNKILIGELLDLQQHKKLTIKQPNNIIYVINNNNVTIINNHGDEYKNIILTSYNTL